jgi:hypothetical protein
MNDMAAANRRGQPANRHEREARRDDQGPRLSDFIRVPAISAAQTGRTYDRSRPVRSKRQKTACQPGRPHIAQRALVSFRFGFDQAQKAGKTNEYFAKRSETFRSAGRKALNSLWVLNQ